MPSFKHLAQELHQLERQGRNRRLVSRDVNGVWIESSAGERLCNFGSNDYLGYAAREVGNGPVGSGASALVSGWTHSHQLLTERLADFESTAAAVLFPSGYAACSGTVATLACKGDVIFSDSLNHASLIDGCRLASANCVIYPHRDMTALKKLLSQHRPQHRSAWIVTDGVFSMDGHLAPLPQICDLAEEFDVAVIVDEAHGTGVIGEHGSGACEFFNVKNRVAVRIGTLSKSIGSHGGFAASSQLIIDYLINRCRSLIYSTSLPVCSVEASIGALAEIQDDQGPRQHLRSLVRKIWLGLGQELSRGEGEIPIIPVIIGDDQSAVEASGFLRNAGFYVPAIRPPTVPEGTARLRISLSAAHSHQMVDDLVGHLKLL